MHLPVQVQDLDRWLEALFSAFKDTRKKAEPFGDWVARSTLPAVRAAQQKHLERLAPPAAAAPAAAAAAPAAGRKAAAAAAASVNGASVGGGAATATLARPAVDDKTLAVLEAAARAQGKTVAELAAELAKQLGKQ